MAYLLRLPKKYSKPLFLGGLVPTENPFGGILERQPTYSEWLNKQYLVAWIYSTFKPLCHCTVNGMQSGQQGEYSGDGIWLILQFSRRSKRQNPPYVRQLLYKVTSLRLYNPPLELDLSADDCTMTEGSKGGVYR
jgi:hypothetical protein